MSILTNLRNKATPWLGRALSKLTGATTALTRRHIPMSTRPEQYFKLLPYMDPCGVVTEADRKNFRLMLKDSVVRPAFLSKVLAVASLDLSVSPEDADNKHDNWCAEFCKYSTLRMNGGIVGLVEAILPPLLVDGYVLAAKERQPLERGKYAGQWTITSLEPKHPDLYEVVVNQYGKPIKVVGRGPARGDTYDDLSDFVFATFLPMYGNPTGTSDMQAAYTAYWRLDTIKKLRHSRLRNLSNGVFMVGKYGQTVSQATLVDAIKAGCAGGFAVVPDDVVIESLNIAGGSNSEFQTAVQDLTNEIILCITGAILQMTQGSTGSGSYAQSKVHQGGADLFVWHLADVFARILNQQVFPDLCDLNRVGFSDYPRASFGGVSDEALAPAMVIDEGLARLGIDTSKKETLARYRRSPPADAGDTFKPAPQPMPSPGGAGLGAIHFSERVDKFAFDESKIIRDDQGQFATKGDIADAKGDSTKEAALRARVTDPEQRAKLDKALGGKGASPKIEEVVGDDRWMGKYKVGDKQFVTKKDAQKHIDSMKPPKSVAEPETGPAKPTSAEVMTNPTKHKADDFVAAMATLGDGVQFRGKDGSMSAANTEEFSREFHRNSIKRALKKGDPVPPEVLADYPDLAKKVGATGKEPLLPPTPPENIERKVKDFTKQVVGTQPMTQKRAAVGGEIGPNGEHYPGGAFIATQDMPKKVKEKFQRAATGKVQVDGYEWAVPKPGQMSILDKLGGTVMNPRNGEVNYSYLNYQKYTPAEVAMYEDLASRWKKGERWVSVNDYPSIAGFKDVARLVVSGQAIPVVLLDGMSDEFKGHVARYKPTTFAERDVALTGQAGREAEALLAASQQAGIQTLAEICESAFGRVRYGAFRLFTDEERQRLADALAATTATAHLLGQKRLRDQLAKRSKKPVAKFADPAPIRPLPPVKALEYFRNLVPGISGDPLLFGQTMQRQAFTLAVTTEETLLTAVQDAIAKTLETGAGGTYDVYKLMESAGVLPANPQYSEMVMRTNALDSYTRGYETERTDPDVVEMFPVWRYDTSGDSRVGDDHSPMDGKYYPASVSFAEVRGKRVYNCRCVPTAVFLDDWEELKRNGARVETRW